MPLDIKLLGTGIYTPQAAARLIGINHLDILRWTRGGKQVKPLWHAYYQLLDGSTELNFRDLLEARVVASLRRAGVSLQAIRYAIQFARDQFGLDRPLSSGRFRTDGSEILIEAFDDTDELTSLSPKRAGQLAFKSVVEQSQVDLEYEGDDPVLWRPRRHHAIVVDPARAFGDPILESSGISTLTLRHESDAGSNAARIAKLYEIDINEVRSALTFERALDGKRPL